LLLSSDVSFFNLNFNNTKFLKMMVGKTNTKTEKSHLRGVKKRTPMKSSDCIPFAVKPTQATKRKIADEHAHSSTDEHRRPVKRGKLSKGDCKSGKLTRNPFLNFLREIRPTLCGHSVVQVAIEGGKRWRNMTDSQKLAYYQDARKVPRKPVMCVCPMPGKKAALIKASQMKKNRRKRRVTKK
jgi:hypothetical protein